MRARTIVGGRAALVASALLLGTALTPAWSAPARAVGPCEVTASDLALDSEEQAALDALNAARQRAGLGPVAPSVTLTRSAVWKSAQMAGGAPFAHNDGSRAWFQRTIDCGYNADVPIRENIAWGYSGAADTLQMWLDSPIHRANLLSPEMRAVGLARMNGPSGWMWTAVLGAALDEPLTVEPGM